jgi:outer membrane protein OmpA-like peptidoglycan-associated protein
MTKSSTTTTPEQTPVKRPSSGRSPLVVIFRLLLLGVGGIVAGLVGVAIAQFYPAPARSVEQPPLLEQIFRHSHDWTKPLRRLIPNTGASPSTLTDSAAPSPVSSSPIAPSLTTTERQNIQTKLTTLQTELTALGDRTTTLETQLGQPHPPAPLEIRLQNLIQLLNPTSTASPVSVPIAQKATATDDLQVTLPSDALFAADQTSLRPDSQSLLTAVVSELQRYPGATIRIAAHTDTQNQATDARDRSFAQARSVEQSLSQTLGNQYHWVVIGYGQTEPIAANDTVSNRQRNRRVEIGIEPSE